MSSELPSVMQKLNDRAAVAAVPLNAYLELTYRCNWRCVFCYNPRHHDLRALKLEDWDQVVEDLRALGTLYVNLTGGEPLVHPGFFEIAGSIRRRAMAVRVLTNGSLIDERAADRMAALRPASVELSLHGATAETHDRTTERKGSYDALWRGVGLLQERGVRLVLKTPLTNLNEHELDAMIERVAAQGIPHRIDPGMMMRDDGDPGPLRYSVSRAGIERLMERLADVEALPATRRVAGGTNCGLGRTTVTIDPEGNVFPCPQWRRSAMGNVRQARLAELWRGSAVRQQAAGLAIAVSDRLLAMGEPFASMPYCPITAEEQTGDPLRPDVAFVSLAEIVGAARRRAARGSGPEQAARQAVGEGSWHPAGEA
jgi:MoaA/NifB/PqqE/SkfB family radical SAM enzyme